MPNVTVKHRFIHQAPRKLRLAGDMVRGLPVDRAIAELGTLSQTASTTLQKLLKSGVAAAKEQGLALSALFVHSIMVDEGPKLKRFIPQSRGRSSSILKRMSHVTISLTDEPLHGATSKAFKREKVVATAAKKATKKTEATTVAAPVVAAEPAVETNPAAEGSK